MTEVQERRKKTVEASMTEQVHLIMQQHLNGGGRLFGGALMQLSLIHISVRMDRNSFQTLSQGAINLFRPASR